MTYSRHIDVKDSTALVTEHAPVAAAKLLGLEILRFAAALAVLMNHYRFFSQMNGMPATNSSQFPLYSILWPFYEHGNYGVELFWGISGYIFFWKYGEPVHERLVSASNFFWLRLSRLYPLHLITLLAVAALQAVHRQITGDDFIYSASDPSALVRQLFLATDWGPPAEESFNGPIWSISAEVAIYAAFFLLVIRFRPSVQLCLTMVLAGIVLQLAGLGWASIGCATYFFIGGLVALIPCSRERTWGALIAGFMGILIAAGLFGERSQAPLALMLAVPSILIIATNNHRWMEQWERQIQFLGNLTYSSYLLHFPIQLSLAIIVAHSNFRPNVFSLSFLLGWLAITLMAAAICYRTFELPVQAMIRRYTVKP